jgi:DNA-binding NtrC family response regulator
VQVGDLEPSNPQLGVRSLDTEALTMLDFNQAKQQVLESFETLYLSSVLERTGHNISRAAREAGMDRSNFRRLLKKLQRH